MTRLDRFRDAQADPHAGFTAALRELEAGRKTGHWIWYVFPQLGGLGQSMTAVHYGLADPAEAADYLREPVLGERLVAAAAAARRHLTGSPRVGVVTLMGSAVDALKLVSCMTLFAHVAAALDAENPNPRFAAMADHGRAILAATAASGYDRCVFTDASLNARAPDSGRRPGRGGPARRTRSGR